MSSDTARVIKAGAISLGLLVVVLWMADIQSIDLSNVRPALLIPTMLAYVAVLALRASVFRMLARNQVTRGFTDWLRLVARHHLVFVLSPSGAGDLAFPILAKRMVGLPTAAAIRVIAEARLRDVCAILGLGSAGLGMAGYVPVLAFLAALAFGVALVWSDVTFTLAKAAFRRFRPAAPETQDAAIQDQPSLQDRLKTAALTLTIWLMASFAIALGFAAAGFPLTLAQSWVMLAGLNIAGALALSLAGFGVTEAGATGVLVFLGIPLSMAAAVAIVARPLLLLSNVAASGVVESVTWAFGKNAPPP